MADGDYYITYARARAALGNPSLTALSDAQLEESLKQSFGRIHSIANISVKETNSFYVDALGNIQSNYLKHQYKAMRLGKETNNVNEIEITTYDLTEDDLRILQLIEKNNNLGG